MNKISICIILLFSIIIGCAPDLIPSYISIFNPGSLSVLSSDTVSKVDCEDRKATSVCNASYVIDIKSARKFATWNALGAGQIIYATKYKCLSNDKVLAVFDDIAKPGKLFDIFNLYQTVDIPSDCDKVQVEAWGPYNAVRKGQIGGRFVLGESLAVQNVKRWSEFFCREVYQAFVFCMILLSLISVRLREAVSDLKKDEIDETMPFWIICAVSSVGLVQLFIPIISLPQITNRIGTIFILSAFFLPFLVRPDQKRFNRNIKISTLCFFSVLMFLPNFQLLFLGSVGCISICGLIIGFRKRSIVLTVLAFVEVLSALKVYGIRPLPNAMIAYFFVGLLSFYKLSLRLKITSSFSTLVSFVSKLDSRPAKATSNIDEVIRTSRLLIRLPVFTFLRIQADSKILITQYEIGGEKFFVEAVPPIFAHSMSLRKEVWHLRVGSPEFQRIKKVGSADWSRGQYISVIPVYDEEKMYGAIAISGYDKSVVDIQEFNIEQKAILRVVVDNLRSLLKKEESFQKSFWNELFITSNNIISELTVLAEDETFPLAEVASELSRVLDASIFIAQLDLVSRKFAMKGIHGFDAFVQERFIKGTVYANLDNEQGPIALAVNRKQPIIISDVQLLKDVLHENSVQFFAKNNTLSCAGLPIFNPGTSEVWGVLWLERSKSLLPFDSLSEGPLTSLAAAVSLYIQRREKDQSIAAATSTLHTFIPFEVFDDVINNGKTREDDHGYMMMLDLKGSTKISLEKGSDFWLAEAAKIKQPLTDLGEKYGFKLREYKWDAFVFSRTSELVTQSAVEEVVNFCRESSRIIEEWYLSSFTSVSIENREVNQKARYCVTFGDVSRGLIEGTVKTWGMIGAEIAAVTKMEDYCKKLPGVIFFDESIAVESVKRRFIDCNTIVASTQRRIFTVSESWIEMTKVIDDAA